MTGSQSPSVSISMLPAVTGAVAADTARGPTSSATGDCFEACGGGSCKPSAWADVSAGAPSPPMRAASLSEGLPVRPRRPVPSPDGCAGGKRPSERGTADATRCAGASAAMLGAPPATSARRCTSTVSDGRTLFAATAGRRSSAAGCRKPRTVPAIRGDACGGVASWRVACGGDTCGGGPIGGGRAGRGPRLGVRIARTEPRAEAEPAARAAGEACRGGPGLPREIAGSAAALGATACLAGSPGDGKGILDDETPPEDP